MNVSCDVTVYLFLPCTFPETHNSATTLMHHVFKVTVMLICICFALDDISRYASKMQAGGFAFHLLTRHVFHFLQQYIE